MTARFTPHLPMLIMAALAHHAAGPEGGFTLTLSE